MSALPVARVRDRAEHGSYSKAAMERAMKIQEVLLRATARWEAFKKREHIS
jgi:hypothetical protein